MPFVQAQLVKWGFPTFALILGFIWYRRRRPTERVDPGGVKCLKLKAESGSGQKSLVNGNSSVVGNKSPNGKLSDSGIHDDEEDDNTSFSLSNISATGSPKSEEREIVSPRKVSESLDIPNRKSSAQSMSLHSCKSLEMNNPPWYEDVETPPEEIQLSSNPVKNNLDFLQTKSKSSSSDKQKNRITETIHVNEEVNAKIVVANNTAMMSGNVMQQDNNMTSKNEKRNVEEQQKQQQQQETTTTTVIAGSSSDNKKQRQDLTERDSANHSPVSGVLEGSVTDEARSEGSTDSGKGGSINGHNIKDISRTVYEFSIPTKLVGKLIGRNHRFITNLRTSANVNCTVKRHPFEHDCKLCCIDGTPENIMAALDMIRQLFPEKTYPYLTLEQLAYEQLIPEEIPWAPELMQLSLIEGVNNDVIVSHIISPNHLFIQLPTHPTYPSLRILDEKMTQLYDTVESPPVPDELDKGMLVVAKWYGKWVRVFIENPDLKGEQTLVRLVDHGGYWTFSHAEMRKIRSDYLTLPFQAIEVFLANLQPKDGEWSQDAYDIVAQICNGTVGQAQIVGYVDSSTFINLYFNIQKHGVISLADELIARGMAEPMSLEEVVASQDVLASQDVSASQNVLSPV